MKNEIKRVGHRCLFSGHNADKIDDPCATNKCDYFPMRCVISHRVRLSLIVYSSTSQKNVFKYPALLYSLKEA